MSQRSNLALLALLALGAAPAYGQSLVGSPQTLAPPQKAPVITLDDALRLARANSPELQAAATSVGFAHAARLQARSLLLPSLTSVNAYVSTQAGANGGPVFIASNGAREYVSQASVHAVFGVAETAAYRSAAAAEDIARAETEIATRGLVVTVVRRFDAVVVSQRKYATAQQADADARQFVALTQKRETGGESAHADVVKARIQAEQRRRDLREAERVLKNSVSELAIVIFPTYDTAFTVADDLATPAPLPAFETVRAQAARENPVLAAAEAALRQARQDLWTARGRMLPSLAVDYLYGLDASHVARSTDGVRNVGSSIMFSVNVPLWNWGASQGQIAAARLQQTRARVDVSFAQRQLLANLDMFYEEAQAARDELDSLRRSVDLAADSLRLTTLRYQAGESTVLEVVDAQTTLVTARYAYDDGQARYHLALANLQTLTGKF